MYIGIGALVVLAVIGIRLHRWTKQDDDRGSVSSNWLAEERGKRDGET